jgi:magnesium-transporting ATPase (P-type)
MAGLLLTDSLPVGMVGDGANDCGALKASCSCAAARIGHTSLHHANNKQTTETNPHTRTTQAADAGLSISNGEAAIAAPFTASSVTSVIQLILEGRCALATTFSLFKFMLMYSIIQFAGILLCYTGLSLFSDRQFLWVDMFCILPLSITLGLTPPVNKLVPQRPPPSMLCLSSLASILGCVLLAVVPYRVVLGVWAPSQPWYSIPAGIPANGAWHTQVTLPRHRVLKDGCILTELDTVHRRCSSLSLGRWGTLCIWLLASPLPLGGALASSLFPPPSLWLTDSSSWQTLA